MRTGDGSHGSHTSSTQHTLSDVSRIMLLRSLSISLDVTQLFSQNYPQCLVKLSVRYLYSVLVRSFVRSSTYSVFVALMFVVFDRLFFVFSRYFVLTISFSSIPISTQHQTYRTIYKITLHQMDWMSSMQSKRSDRNRAPPPKPWSWKPVENSPSKKETYSKLDELESGTRSSTKTVR